MKIFCGIGGGKMKKNAVKCVAVIVFVVMYVCILSTTMVNRVAETNGFNNMHAEDIKKYGAADTTGAAKRASIVLNQFLTFSQLGAILVVLILLSMLVKTIKNRIKTKQELKKEISDDFTKEQKKEIEKKYKILVSRMDIIIVVIIVLLSASGIVEIIKRFAVKPIIYIYPEENGTSISVMVSDPEKLTCTYPKYNDGWKVIADKDGTLTDESGRKYYALYWEGKDYKISDFEEGFVVKGEDTAAFLEEKLAILGLNERETEEFIVYWLPILERNNYNLIRFKTAEEINSDMELEITPKPDTLIRVMMEYKPLMFKRSVKEQVLEKVERKGYTVVEWGGIK